MIIIFHDVMTTDKRCGLVTQTGHIQMNSDTKQHCTYHLMSTANVNNKVSCMPYSTFSGMSSPCSITWVKFIRD